MTREELEADWERKGEYIRELQNSAIRTQDELKLCKQQLALQKVIIESLVTTITRVNT